MARWRPELRRPRTARGFALWLALAVLVPGVAGIVTGLARGGPASAGIPAPGATAAGPSGTAPPATSASPSSSAAGGSEQAELGKITAAVRASAQARQEVVEATQAVGACTMSPAAGEATVDQAVRLRESVATATAQLPVDAIPGGPEMLRDLLGVLGDSVAADRGFSGWMSDMAAAGTCPISTNSDSSYQAALQDSSRAVVEKGQFLQIWNPLARRFGQPVFTEGNI